jgi:hypothetical protein
LSGFAEHTKEIAYGTLVTAGSKDNRFQVSHVIGLPRFSVEVEQHLTNLRFVALQKLKE